MTLIYKITFYDIFLLIINDMHNNNFKYKKNYHEKKSSKYLNRKKIKNLKR